MIAVSNLLSSTKKDLLLMFNFSQNKFHRCGLFLMPRQIFEYGIIEDFQSNMGFIYKRQLDEPGKLLSGLQIGVCI